MADEVDHAARQTQFWQEQMLAQRQPEGPKATGYCQSPLCGEPVPEGYRFCDARCRDDWEQYGS